MSLVDCADCGKDLSDKAHQCPHCGRPYRGSGLHRRLSHVEIIVVILTVLVVWNLVPMLVMLLA
jgi:predicted amidophosphoribosyltransferase